MMSGGSKAARAFGVAADAVSWAGILMRVAYFLLFSTTTVWRKVTFGTLAALLGVAVITSGLVLR